jgi:hypothetical protein
VRFCAVSLTSYKTADRFLLGRLVLMSSSRIPGGELTSSYERAKFLVVGYNCVAQENGKEAIDIDSMTSAVPATSSCAHNRKNSYVDAQLCQDIQPLIFNRAPGNS